MPEIDPALHHRKCHAGILIISALCFLNCLVWSWKIPPGDAPDEPDHFWTAAFIAEHTRLPVVGKDVHAYVHDLTDRVRVPLRIDPRTGTYTWQFKKGHRFEIRKPYASYPGLNYVIAAFFIRAGELTGYHRDYFWPRMSSNVFAAVTVYLVGLLALQLFPARPLRALLACILVAALPQFTFVGAYVNSDAYTAMAAAFLFWSLYRGMAHRWVSRSSVLFGAGVGLVLLGKFNGYIVVPLGIAGYVLTAPSEWRRSAMRAGLAALLIAGPWLVHNWRTYGELSGLKVAEKSLEDILNRYPTDGPPLSQYSRNDPPRNYGYTYIPLLTSHWMVDLVQSFIGNFGWADKPMPTWSYLAWGMLMLVSGASVAWGIKKKWPLSRDSRTTFLVLAFSALPLAFLMTLYNSVNIDLQPQGRYLFPGLSGLMISAAYGLLHPFPDRNKQTIVILAVAALVIAINLAALARVN